MSKPEYNTVQSIQNSFELAEIAFESGEPKLAADCTRGALHQLADYYDAPEYPSAWWNQ